MNQHITRLVACLDTLQHHLDVTHSVLQVKLLWLYRIQHTNDHYRVDITDPVDPPRHVMTIVATSSQLKGHHDALMADIRRAFINDLFLTVARDGIVARNIIDGQKPARPEFHQHAHEGEITALMPFVAKEYKPFLEFFRRIRNSAVHYDGNHNRRNAVDFVFNGSHFLTTEENIGTQIQYWMSDLVAMYHQLKAAFHTEDIVGHPYLRRRLQERLG